MSRYRRAKYGTMTAGEKTYEWDRHPRMPFRRDRAQRKSAGSMSKGRQSGSATTVSTSFTFTNQNLAIVDLMILKISWRDLQKINVAVSTSMSARSQSAF